MDLKGRIVIITGGTGNLGKAVTEAFLDSGAKTVVTYIIDEEAVDLRSNLEHMENHPMIVKVDVLSPESLLEIVEEVLDKFGRIDALVHLVGGFRGDNPVVEMSQDDWDSMLNLNLKSAFLCANAVLPAMIGQESGRITMISSKAAEQPFVGASAYSVAKAGIITLVRTIADEVKDSGITANCVMPSIIDTEQNRRSMPKADFDKWVKPEDLARVLLFLSSDASKDINGASIPVYGRV